MPNQSSRPIAHTLTLILLVAIVYFVSARTSLLLAFQYSNATPVWPPSGIALAVLLLFGYRLWPGIMLGAFAANVFVFLSNKSCDLSTALWVSSLISIGNTLEALAGYYLVRTLTGGNYIFERAANIFLFVLAALLMCIVSSGIGPLCVCLAKIIAWDNYPTVWFTWWTGDVSGVLLVTPFIVVWAKSFHFKLDWEKAAEIAALFFSTFLTSEIIFNDWLFPGLVWSRAYIVIPFLLWAALRFGLREVVTAIVVISSIAVWGTIHGRGPFVTGSLNLSLLSLQGFISVISFTFLILSIALDERKQTEATLKVAREKLHDAIMERTNKLSATMEEMESQTKSIKKDEKRLNNIMNSLLQTSRLDFSGKIEVSEKGDEIDAIAVGFNTMSEELEFHLQQLKISEQKFKTLLESAPDALVIVDNKGKIVLINSQTKKLFGYKRDELYGSTVEILIPKRFHDKHVPHREKYVHEPKVREMGAGLNLSGRRKDGTEFPVEISLSPMQTEQGIWVSAAIRDISERKKSEEIIKQSEEKFNAAFQASPAGIIIANGITGKYLDVNDSFLKMIGYQREEVIGHTSLDLNLVVPVDRERVMKELNKIGALKNIESVVIKKSGEKAFVLFSNETIVIKGEKCFLTVLYDITDRKKTEAELQQKSEELARSNQELEQFAYVASHDLQEPLRMVTSYVQLLEKRYKDKLDTDANDFIHFAVDGSNRMRTLINSLLDYSRINLIKSFEPISTNQLLEEVLQDLSDYIKENNAVIKIDTLPHIYGDPVLIGQVFQNLITNSIKFKSNTKPEINISAKESNGEVLFSLKDNGIGIQKEYSEKIFVIFQRLHNKDTYPGTGIGLSICKKIVERHGGKIWLESEMGNGSTFYFTIKSDSTRGGVMI